TLGSTDGKAGHGLRRITPDHDRCDPSLRLSSSPYPPPLPVELGRATLATKNKDADRACPERAERSARATGESAAGEGACSITASLRSREPPADRRRTDA